MESWKGNPDSLERLQRVVWRASYKPDWSFGLHDQTVEGEHLNGSSGWHLSICAQVPDSSRPGETANVRHYFSPPPADWNEAMWKRWVFQCVLDVETHEAMEFFAIEGIKPFYPSHGTGISPYLIQF